MKDNNHVNVDTEFIYDSIKFHASQNTNDNYDSENSLFLTYNNEINGFKHDKDNNTQNKYKYND